MDQGPDNRMHALVLARAGWENTGHVPPAKQQGARGSSAKLYFLHRNVNIRLDYPYIASSPCQHSQLSSYLEL